MNDLWSGLYLGYHVYLHVAPIDAPAPLRPLAGAVRTGRLLDVRDRAGRLPSCSRHGAGGRVPGAVRVTAARGALTRLNTEIVARLASRYDAFPSLHVLVTAALLACDWRWCRTRFWIMLLPGLGLMFATLPLRLHSLPSTSWRVLLLLGLVLWLTFPKESDDAA